MSPKFLLLLLLAFQVVQRVPRLNAHPTHSRGVPQIPWQPALPDVVVFFIDDVGYDDYVLLSTETPQNPSDRTPAITAIMRAGTQFTRGYAQPMCAPSRMSIYTGEWQGTTGGFGCNADPAFPSTPDIGPTSATLPGGLPSLPRSLAAIGYHAVLVGRWGLGTFPDANAGEEDFAHAPEQWGYGDTRAVLTDGVNACVVPPAIASYSNWLRVDDGDVTMETTYATVAVRDAFIEWWNTTPSPRFAFVSLPAAHMGGQLDGWHIPPPAAMPPGYVAPFPLNNRKRYEAMIQSADYAIHLMMQAIKASDPALAETLVMVLADNGTPSAVPPPLAHANRLKFTVFEGGVNVPWGVAGLSLPAGQVSTQPISIVDVIPTLLELCGIAPQASSFDGQSFLPALMGQPLERDWVYVQHSAGGDNAVIRFDYKLHQTESGVETLYDMVNDPGETTPISVTEPGFEPIVDELRAARAVAQSS